MTIKFMFSKSVGNSNEVLRFIKEFNSDLGILFGDGQRNKIKLFELERKMINIKSFKIPNMINKIAYKYFRKSKARRSFEYATILLEKGIGTPQPIAYFENFDFWGLNESYYVSEHLESDLTFRELVEIPDYPDHDAILRQFTKFSFDLHEKGIEFLDHSPGNTLIKKVADAQFSFYLVDLNRMTFHDEMDFDARMKNLSRLTPKKEMIAVMSDEYAKYYRESSTSIFDKMWQATGEFQEKFAKKKRLKKKLKFWES
ncbi:lipopolysaccharide kinase InaA family protein [Flavobacterium sp. RSP15]|uniref:lipopolysaccharide kinase InaA family protein n=1 Tax=Flavobacterium sp. RSP15 TaxID=2497485 RepID=UPI001F236506|nr:lipopolysaccharide kinase InaA family protein [Flavobacterium sp. RSP15]